MSGLRPSTKLFHLFGLDDFRQGLVAVLGLLAAFPANAEEAPAFPADPGAWINSGPLTVSGLKGKGIVLWFFEEQCPKCRDRWPELIRTAEKFDGRPVVFIAVNSGNPRNMVEQYVQEVGVKPPWIVMVDPTRDFEKACQLIKEISLENISQVRYIKPDGEILPGLTDDIEEIAKSAIEGAAWKVDPIGIPASMKSAWWGVEIGNYKGLASSLKKATTSSKPDVKELGTKLMAIVQQEINDQMEGIKAAQEAGNPYKAYEIVSVLSDRFMGFELPKEVPNLKKDLSKDAKVKAGLTASKSLESVRRQLGSSESGSKNKAHEKALKSLEKIISDFPDTTLAKQAQALYDYSK